MITNIIHGFLNICSNELTIVLSKLFPKLYSLWFFCSILCYSYILLTYRMFSSLSYCPGFGTCLNKFAFIEKVDGSFLFKDFLLVGKSFSNSYSKFLIFYCLLLIGDYITFWRNYGPILSLEVGIKAAWLLYRILRF